ncbi:MAG: serine/threonine-protein phosphatase [Nitrospirae bacterium]|nr:serine/threonine-protein phosphatase [Nitrospirota bacterium]
MKEHPVYHIDYGKNTHIGGRSENQDYSDAVIDPEHLRYCFAVADGLGGHLGGQMASKTAVMSIMKAFPNFTKDNINREFTAMFHEANEIIKEKSKAQLLMENMKTTCVVLVIIEDKAYWAHVGDSRLYVFRKWAPYYRTKDHSVVQLLLDIGEIGPDEVLKHPDRNKVTRNLGMTAKLEPSVFANGLELNPGDCFLLCTDGFWQYMNEKEIALILRYYSDNPAQKIIDILFDKAITKARSGDEKKYDNLTAQLVIVR